MVRRTKAEAAATREALLDAAERVFRARGVAHASLAEIAAAAGLTRGALYWHFRDKADLLKALTDRVQLPMEAMLARAGRERHKDPLGVIRELAIFALTSLAEDPRKQAVLDVVTHKCELASEFGSIAARSHNADNSCHASVERLLRQAVAARQLPRDTDTQLAACSLGAFVAGLMREWVQQPTAYDLRNAAPMMIDTFLAGLRVRPPRRAAAPAARTRSLRARAAPAP
jgi:TetR/AcrR family transcriptional regulator, acrAB operon repressor